MQFIKTLLRPLAIVLVATFLAAPAYAQYCTAGATSTSFEKISRVRYLTIDNSSTATAGYEDFTAISTTAFVGGTNNITVDISGPFSTDQVFVWIDFNQNSSFADAGELVYTSAQGVGPHVGAITIPATALSGNTRMRVRMHDADAFSNPNNTPCGNSGFGQVEDYSLNIQLNTPCSGTPTPGNTLTSATPVCSGANFTLSLQNSTSGTGVTYQWQSASSAAGPWSNITGATNSTLTTSQTNATFYRCNATCSGNTGTSNPVQVTMNIPTNCYCAAGATSTSFEKISRVRYNQIDNASTSGAGYENFTTFTTAAYLGATSAITVDISGGFSSDQTLVWIDFNQNGFFTDPGELVFTSGTSTGPHVGNITIPATALQGNTRMRVRMHDSDAFAVPNNTPCGSSGFGQVEDYTVNIQVCVPVTYTTQPASTSITCGGNATFAVTANGSAPVYGWQFRVNASSPWQDLVNGGIYAGATTNTLTLTNVLASYNGYQYRALLSGACAALDYSQPATLTVNPIVPVVTPASATICNGSVQALSLTNTLSNTDLITESFNNIPGLAAAGWSTVNLSSPLGTATGWAQGVTTAFPAYSGAATSYVTANYTSTGATGTISNWLLTPSVAIKNGDQLKFWTRTTDGTYPDRMEVRMSTNGTSTNVGATATSVGDFTTLLLTINPNLTTGSAYPSTWTQFTATVSGLAAPTTGRFAFRYFVTNGGSAAPNSDYIGLDDVVFTSVGAPAQGVWTSSPASPNTMFTDAAATVPYAGAPATTIYVKPAANTTYSVQFTTPGGCTSSVATVPVSVSQPVTGLSVTPSTRAVCVGGSTTFSATTTGGSPITYQWQRSTDGGLTYANISGATSATLTVTNVTQSMTGYLYRMVATAAPCGSVTSSNVASLTVNPLPVVTLSSPVVRLVPGRTTTLTASSTPNAAANGWSWTSNGAAIPGTTNTQVVNIDQLGTYQATVVDVNGCTSKSNELVISAEATDKLWIYPNPTVNGAFQVRLYFAGELAENRVVTVYNPLGQVIESKTFSLVRGSAPYQRMDFNLGGGATAKGAYVVKVAHLYTGKVISGIVLVQ